MDYEDLQFTAAGLVLTLTGTVAAMLAAAGLATGTAPAVVLLPVAVALLAAGSALSASRRWSMRLAQSMYPLAGAMWALVLLVDGTAGSTATCVALAAGCVWASRFLGDALRPPRWTSVVVAGPDPVDAGWIEDLPVDGGPFEST